MSGENTKGLTVVISPLQSLMKDQVDNLEKVGITDAATINGLLDPIERGKSLKELKMVQLLYFIYHLNLCARGQLNDFY